MAFNRIIIFDYGCVISKPQDEICVNAITRKLGLKDAHEFKKIYSIHRQAIDSGLISLREYWLRTLKEINLTLPEDDIGWLILEDIRSWAVINEETIGLVKELKAKGHRLAILSNMVTETLDYLKKNTSFIPLFDHPFFSCEFNRIKPDPAAYRYVLEKMNARAEDCIFIDDLAVNCEAAEKLGMRAIQFTDVTNLRMELAAIL
jgi:putative hydrolase of the HAD superfamily